MRLRKARLRSPAGERLAFERSCSCSRPRNRGFRALHDRQSNDERRPFTPNIIVSADFAAVLSHSAVTDAQSQASPLAHFFSGKEWVEDVIDFANPIAVVAEGDFHHAGDYCGA